MMTEAHKRSKCKSRDLGDNIPFLPSVLTTISPLTIRPRKLGRSDANREIKANVDTRDGQNPWNVSTFSQRV